LTIAIILTADDYRDSMVARGSAVKKFQILTSVFALVFFATGYAQVHGQANISAPAAMEIALAMTGGGTVNSLELVSGATGLMYQIVIVNNAIRYEVSVDAQTGAIVRLSTGQTGAPPVAVPQQGVQPQGGGVHVGNVVPRPPARHGGPANPPISAQRAVELARNHLVAMGVTHARFDYVYMDIERGRWVWSVEFDGCGRDYEFYVDVITGEFLEAPGMDGCSRGDRGRR